MPTLSLFHFSPWISTGSGSRGPAQVWGIISLPRESQMKGSCGFYGPGGQKEGERKGLGGESSKYQVRREKKCHQGFPPPLDKEVSAEAPEKGFCQSPSTQRPPNGAACTRMAERLGSTAGQGPGALDCYSLQRLQCTGSAPSLGWRGQLSLCVFVFGLIIYQ